MERAILDRIEEGMAVCEGEDGSFFSLPAEKLPEHAREGDCLILRDGAWEVEREATARRREETAALFRRLTQRRPPEEPEKKKTK